MKVDNKLINFKISKNGKFQMTGVKYDEQAVKCIKFFWKSYRHFVLLDYMPINLFLDIFQNSK